MKKFNTTQEIRVGVIGYGGAFNMGRQHLEQMQAAGMTPVAVAEVDPDRLAVAGEDFPGIGMYSTVTEMLERSDGGLVVIITPHNSHAPLALECLRAGRHVVCEKPLAITTDEVDAMIAAANEAGVMLSTYHNRHWDGRVLLARKLILEEKQIGDIIRIECRMGAYGKPGDWWRTSRTISGGILYDWGVHLLEYSLQLLGCRATEVSGFAHNGFWGPETKWKDDANEDEGFLVARFEGGRWLTLRITQIDSTPPEGWVEVTGTKGTFILDGSHSTLRRHTEKGYETLRIPNPPDEGHRYYENVSAYLTGREELVITADWSRRPIEILDLGVRSAKEGHALVVPTKR